MRFSEEVDIYMGINKSRDEARRHRYQIKRERRAQNLNMNGILPNRTAATWNRLPSEMVIADIMDNFKAKMTT